MATSAFRSTTRRGCQIGSGNAEPSVPSTPRSKRDPSPSPSGRGLHRRSTSMSDFSAATKYLSDCDYQPSYMRDTKSRAGGRSVCPSDSESDMENVFTHRRNRRWSAESEDEGSKSRSFSVRHSIDSQGQGFRRSASSQPPASQGRGLRRTLSSQDLLYHNQNMEYGMATVPANQTERNDALHYKPAKEYNIIHAPGDQIKRKNEHDFVEEKTIRAVYDQIKLLRPDPPVGDLGLTDFLSAMKSEVRRAVTDIRQELEESVQKNGKLKSTLSVGKKADRLGIDAVQAVAQIRKEYAAKLDESERKVRELWSQIAVEERRCLELSKIVKELLPVAPPADAQTDLSQSSNNRRRPLRRKNSAERQLALESLDDEAQKFFDECVSISSFDYQEDSDDSFIDKENSGSVKKCDSDGVKGSPTSAVPPVINAKVDKQQKNPLLGSDGVVLPWLKWEDESGDKNLNQGNKKLVTAKDIHSETTTNRHNSPNKYSGNGNQRFSRTNISKSNPSSKITHLSWNSARSLSDNKLVGGLFHSNDSTLQGGDYFQNLDDLLLEKINFSCRVEKGELLLCQPLFLM